MGEPVAGTLVIRRSRRDLYGVSSFLALPTLWLLTIVVGHPLFDVEGQEDPGARWFAALAVVAVIGVAALLWSRSRTDFLEIGPDHVRFHQGRRDRIVDRTDVARIASFDPPDGTYQVVLLAEAGRPLAAFNDAEWLGDLPKAFQEKWAVKVPYHGHVVRSDMKQLYPHNTWPLHMFRRPGGGGG